MKETWILGVSISDRKGSVAGVQSTLEKFGCSIRTRLGLHDTGEGAVAGCGLILLELHGDNAEFSKLELELSKIQGVEVKKMTFRRG